GNVWVIDSCRRPCLRLESRCGHLIGTDVEHDLECNVAIRTQMHRLVHRTHAACTQEPDQLVATRDDLSDSIGPAHGPLFYACSISVIPPRVIVDLQLQ